MIDMAFDDNTKDPNRPQYYYHSYLHDQSEYRSQACNHADAALWKRYPNVTDADLVSDEDQRYSELWLKAAKGEIKRLIKVRRSSEHRVKERNGRSVPIFS